PFHAAYLGLADELGLTIVPSFPQLPGSDTWVLADGRYVGDDFPWMGDADRASFAALSDEFGALARSVDPDDPWSHPEAERLDRLPMADWLGERGGTVHTACRCRTGCATPAARGTSCGRAISPCSRCPPSRSSAPRSWPSSA